MRQGSFGLWAGPRRVQVGRRVTLCHRSRTGRRSEGPEGCREAEPLADGSSWAYRGAGVGFGRQPFKRDVSFEPGRLEGLSRGCHDLHAGEL